MADERIEQLSPGKRALLRRLLADRQAQQASLTPGDATGQAPLSLAQRRLWFLNRLEPNNSYYNVSVGLELEGELSFDAARSAWQTLVTRHGSLRTTFHTGSGVPHQVIHDQIHWTLHEHDLREFDPKDRDQHRQRIATELTQAPFDLSAAPLFRIALLQINDRRRVLLLVLHHIICDGWSVDILVREFLAICNTGPSASNAESSRPTISYADFARWEQAHRNDPSVASDLEYWHTLIGDDPPPLDLPTDRPRPQAPTYQTESVCETISAALLRQLLAIARQERATLYMVLVASWHYLLSRYCDTDRIRTGSPVANRHPAETESIVGLFVNTIVLQSDVNRQSTFREYLHQVRDATLDAFQHQKLPFDRLVERLQPERDPSRAPIVQHLFVMQNFGPTGSKSAPEPGDDRVTLREIDLSLNPSAAFDLTLNATPSHEQLQLLLVFNRELFDYATAERMLHNLVVILNALGDCLDKPLASLPYLAASEQATLREELSGAKVVIPAVRRWVPDLVRDQARRSPDRMAIESDHRCFTYGELQAAADRLSVHLHQLGVQRGDRVGICMSRRPSAVAAMLGVLRIGAAFVPIDPDYPEARVRFLVEDACPAALLVDREARQRHPQLHPALLDVDAILREPPRIDVATPAVEIAGDDIAYLIYTSGSTGEPKAAEIFHRSWQHHTTMMAEQMRLAGGDRRLQCLSLSFDASLEEIFPALATGATLVMHPNPRELSRDEMRRFCTAHDIRHMNLLPALFEPLVQSLTAADRSWVTRFKSVIVGGDRVSPEIMQQWIQFVGSTCRTLFVYGVTEATVANTVYRVPQDFASCSSVPIGRPLPGHRAYVLDNQLQLVPLGAVGELCIGGIGVARGYFGRTELTEERFVRNPFSADATDRIYRTGDLVRWRRDGNLEFAGRADHQLKIRGFRIEAGEIETALLQQPAIREAKVVARSDTHGHKQLVAYLVLADSAEMSDQTVFSEATLRDRLRASLPAHMIPAAFVPLTHFPLAPGNKIDYRALPAPEWKREASARNVTAPRTPCESQWVAIWQRVLNVDPIGIDDNFFQLGGDSILSLQLVSEGAAAGLQITPKQLFLHQTIAELAAVTGTCTRTADTLQYGDAPLTPIQRQFFSTPWPAPHDFTQTIVLQLAPDITFPVFEQAWSHVSASHPEWTSRFVKVDNRVVQRTAPDLAPPPVAWVPEGALPQAALARENTGAADRQLSPGVQDGTHGNPGTPSRAWLEETATSLQTSLNLHDGPVVRGCYVAGSRDMPPHLILCAHHLVVDGVSWRITIAELQRCCAAILANEPAPSIEAAPAFATWSRQLSERAQTYAVRRHRHLWLDWDDTVSTSPRAVTVPNRVRDGRMISLELSETATHQLLTQATATYGTKVDEFLLAAFVAALSEWQKATRFYIDLELHGREARFADLDVSRTAGWFTALVPVSLDLPDDTAAHSIVPATKDQMRRYTRHGSAFGLLRWLVADPEIVAEFPTGCGSTISFNYLGRLDESAVRSPMLRLTDQWISRTSHPDNPRWHLMELNAFVQRDRLRVQLTYHPSCHRDEEVRQLTCALEQKLLEFIAACAERATGHLTPSDFPLADLTADDLSTIVSHVERLGAGQVPELPQ